MKFGSDFKQFLKANPRMRDPIRTMVMFMHLSLLPCIKQVLMNLIRFVCAFALACSFIFAAPAMAEYGDVVINNYAEKQGMRPVVFPHWFHRIRYACKVCHADLGFKFKAGGNDITMFKIIDGQYCGACHNGKIAWSVKNCNLCHSAKPGTPTQVHESTSQELAIPSVRDGR